MSGPSALSRRVLVFRRAPRCSCFVQPLRASHRPNSSMRKEPKRADSSGVAALPPCAALKIDAACGVRAGLGEGRLHAVVGEPAAEGVEVVVAPSSGLPGGRRRLCTGVRAAPERRSTHGLNAAGSPTPRAWSGLKVGYTRVFEARRADLFMVLERVRRVVRRADEGDLVGAEDVVHPEGGQPRVRPLPDRVGRGGADQLPDPEVALQLEVGPVVQRVADAWGTVSTQALNFSRAGASPVQKRSSTPLARIARHL